MNALYLLNGIHDDLLMLLDEIETADQIPGSAKAQLLEDLENLQELHSSLEATIFYPVLKDYPELRGLIERCTRQHEIMNAAFADLSGARFREDFLERLIQLKGELMSHIDELELKVFLKAQELLGTDLLQVIGKHMEWQQQGTSIDPSVKDAQLL